MSESVRLAAWRWAIIVGVIAIAESAVRLGWISSFFLAAPSRAVLVLWEQIVHDQKQSEAVIDLAWAYLTKASALSGVGRGREAVELCEKAIAIRRRLVQHDGRPEFRADLARAYLHKANAVRAQQNAEGALPVYDQAIEILTAAQAVDWAPIRHRDMLHDRASYRYFWHVVERAQRTATAAAPALPAGIRQAWFGAAA